jgi:hypothetical protein
MQIPAMFCTLLLKTLAENPIFHKDIWHRSTPARDLHTGGVTGSIPVAPTSKILMFQ